MTPEVQAKVFDPFFTTKTQGRGLGLGLAITCQLVKRNGGTIELASQKGQGATFTIRFPVPATPPATPKPPAIAN
jgi:signal transduction histidine kinase